MEWVMQGEVDHPYSVTGIQLAKNAERVTLLVSIVMQAISAIEEASGLQPRNTMNCFSIELRLKASVKLFDPEVPT